jgi:hypothetical protein
VRSDSYDFRESVRCLGHDDRSSVLKTRNIYSPVSSGLELHVQLTYLPADGAKAGGYPWLFVGGDVNLQVGQRVKIIELAPMLPAVC